MSDAARQILVLTKSDDEPGSALGHVWGVPASYQGVGHVSDLYFHSNVCQADPVS
jgi:hypothetical protein